MHYSLKLCRKQKMELYVIFRIMIAFITAPDLPLLRSLFLHMASSYCLLSFHCILQDPSALLTEQVWWYPLPQCSFI
jgi:hypothetical protein